MHRIYLIYGFENKTTKTNNMMTWTVCWLTQAIAFSTSCTLQYISLENNTAMSNVQ